MSISTAQNRARELRTDLGIEDRRFDLEDLLSAMEIRVVRERPRGGAEGMSLSCGSQDLIYVDPALSQRRWRWTLGHELGHLLLDHGSSPCLASEIHGRPRDPLEAEANAFCANLLLPTRLFRKDIRTVHPRIEEVAALADSYGVSLTATAIRFAALTKDPCAVIGLRQSGEGWISKSGRCEWWVKLPPEEGTLAADHLRGREVAASASVPVGLWAQDASRFDGWNLTEEVVQTGAESWLVLLSEFPDPEDDPNLVDREALEDLESRRKSFRRY